MFYFIFIFFEANINNRSHISIVYPDTVHSAIQNEASTIFLFSIDLENIHPTLFFYRKVSQ